VRVLPNRAKPNQVQSRIRRGPHARTHLLWHILLGSLVADPLIPLITTPQIPLELATSVAVLCAMFILPFLAQSSLHSLLSRLRHMHLKSLDGSRGLTYGLTSAAVLILISKIALAAKVAPLFGLAFVIIIVAGARSYLKKFLQQAEDDKKLFESNPWAKVQRWEQQLIVFVSLPLILARVISLCGAFAELPSDNTSLRFVFLGVSALLLGLLQPNRPFFIGYCRRCKHPTPIVFQDMGSCLNCDAGLRVAYHAWINRLPFPPPPAPAVARQEPEKSEDATTTNRTSTQQKTKLGKAPIRRRLPSKPR